MIKLIKEIFSLSNLKMAMLYGELSNKDLNTKDYWDLVKLIREEYNIANEPNDTREEIELKKAS